MTRIATASSSATGVAGARELAERLRVQLDGEVADALILFVSPQADYVALVGELAASGTARLLVGCSSAGEFTSERAGTGMASAIALRAPDMLFHATIGRELSRDRAAAARQVAGGFRGLDSSGFRYKIALLFVDALAGHTEDLVDQLTLHTAGLYEFAGGGAGDDGAFHRTHVFCGGEVVSDAVVALEILSNKPFGIGARHGWTPASGPLRVTESAASCVQSLNAEPAADVFAEYARATTQPFDRENPLPFFLHNVVGVAQEEGHKLRVPLGITEGGGVLFASDVPTGATARIMSTSPRDAAAAAADAVGDAVRQVREGGAEPKAALFFDCVATRLRLGQEFGGELDAVGKELADAPYVGFNSYGQIVRREGQFSGFHNCTAVALVIPD